MSYMNLIDVGKIKMSLLLNCLLFYSWASCILDSCVSVLCRYIIQYLPNFIVPDIPLNIHLHNDKNLQIDNFQYDNRIITKKIKILLWLLWDNKDKIKGRLFLIKYIKFIGECSMIFIDYHLKMKNPNSSSDDNCKIDRIKKIISIESNNKIKYITPHKTIEIPFGEIIFDAR